jgi:predicted nucleic acid-binding protein
LTVAIDSTVLVFLFDGSASAPIDPATQQPVPNGKARLENLIAELEKRNERLIVPVPALAEVLVRAKGAAPDWLAIIAKSSVIRVADFDIFAAIEFAEMQRLSLATRTADDDKRKMKFDDQIVAIAKVVQASVIYSDDKGIKKRETPEMRVVGIAELSLPPEAAQHNLLFESPNSIEGAS